MKKSDIERERLRGRAVRAEVIRRVMAAIDRCDVALQFPIANPAVVGQGLHAVHYLQRGYADGHGQQDIPADAPDFRLTQDAAEELVGGLLAMLAEARRAKSTWGEQS